MFAREKTSLILPLRPQKFYNIEEGLIYK
jgi:hypothetical protein